MAISKIGKSFIRSVADPLNVGFGAMSYGMGTSSAGGTILGTAAQTAATKLLHPIKEFVVNKVPILKPLGWLADAYASLKAYGIGDKIGNKYIPLTWSKNHIGEQNYNG